ncbi:hypothetical protein CL617_01070 [archaeon]|nr:hypothetical protein [archaeon]
MAKISPVSAKYIVHTQIDIEGAVDKPDVIGAVFGQTEGLLGTDLELRELQRSGRIGRIEVNVDIKGGKSNGMIIIPSSLDKAETAIIGAALETIQRIGPCNSKVRVEKIEDVRVSKRDFVIERAKELLRNFTDSVLPDSQELKDLVNDSVMMMDIVEYGKERLAAGPIIDESDELIVVEGRADVLNLLKQGIKNVIALNGTNIPETIKTLSSKKELTVFVDGDRGGDLIIKGLINYGVEIDFVVKAPDGKEVEEITKKEIHKALRSKIAIEQIKMDIARTDAQQDRMPERRTFDRRPQSRFTRAPVSRPRYNAPSRVQVKKPTILENKKYKDLLDDLVGTKGAYLLDDKLNILGKVPITEVVNSVKELKNVNSVVLDGTLDKTMCSNFEANNLKYAVAMVSKVKPQETSIGILTSTDFSSKVAKAVAA